MRSVPIDVLRAFVAVIEARGFTRAAETLGRTQPTVSLQVKRLEELIEAPLFERASRFEMTGVGAVCFDYGRRLLQLHDDMLDEAARRKTPDATLRVGMPSELAPMLAPRLAQLRADAKVGAAVDVVTDASQGLAAAFRRNALDLAFVAGAGEGDPHRSGQWRAPLRWFGRSPDVSVRSAPLPLVIPPVGSPLREAADAALRAQDRRFDIVCTSPDFAVLAAAASAGLGVTPMIEGLAPNGLTPTAEDSLPPLPALTLSLLARSATLARAGRRWVANVVDSLQAI